MAARLLRSSLLAGTDIICNMALVAGSSDDSAVTVRLLESIVAAITAGAQRQIHGEMRRVALPQLADISVAHRA